MSAKVDEAMYAHRQGDHDTGHAIMREAKAMYDAHDGFPGFKAAAWLHKLHFSRMED